MSVTDSAGSPFRIIVQHLDRHEAVTLTISVHFDRLFAAAVPALARDHEHVTDGADYSAAQRPRAPTPRTPNRSHNLLLDRKWNRIPEGFVSGKGIVHDVT